MGLCNKHSAAFGGKRKFFKSPFRPILLRKIGLNGDLKRILFGGASHQMKSSGFLHNPRKQVRVSMSKCPVRSPGYKFDRKTFARSTSSSRALKMASCGEGLVLHMPQGTMTCSFKKASIYMVCSTGKRPIFQAIFNLKN